MMVAIETIPHGGLDSATLRLAIDVVGGAALFSVSLFALWFATGRPDAPERDVLRYLAARRRAKP